MERGYREVPFLVNDQRRKNPSRRAPRYKISLVKEAGSLYVTAKPIRNAKMIADQLQELFEETDREAFFVVCLDNSKRIIGVNLVSLGTISASLVHPREVFKAAILLNSASIMGVHNHPSGSPEPSMQDRDLTQRLVNAGHILGIKMIDHVIVGDMKYFSFSEEGIMPDPDFRP